MCVSVSYVSILGYLIAETQCWQRFDCDSVTSIYLLK
jgi:hypothetical protein